MLQYFSIVNQLLTKFITIELVHHRDGVSNHMLPFRKLFRSFPRDVCRIHKKLLKHFALSDRDIGHRVSCVRSLRFAAREGSASLSSFLFSVRPIARKYREGISHDHGIIGRSWRTWCRWRWTRCPITEAVTAAVRMVPSTSVVRIVPVTPAQRVATTPRSYSRVTAEIHCSGIDRTRCLPARSSPPRSPCRFCCTPYRPRSNGFSPISAGWSDLERCFFA